MLYQDWDLELFGRNIRITSLTKADEDVYGRLMLGNLYDELLAMGGKLPARLRETLGHTSEDEVHAIRPLLDERMIGWIALQKNCEGQPDIGISLVEDQQNQGRGPEAVRLFCNHLFETYGLRSVFVRISAKNLQSQYAFAKVGAVYVREEMDPRYASLLEKHPDVVLIGDPVRIRFYRIPLPIGPIWEHPGHKMDENARNQAQTEYMEETRQIEKRYQLAELKEIRDQIRNLSNASITDVQEMLEARLAELRGKQ